MGILAEYPGRGRMLGRRFGDVPDRGLFGGAVVKFFLKLLCRDDSPACGNCYQRIKATGVCWQTDQKVRPSDRPCHKYGRA